MSAATREPIDFPAEPPTGVASIADDPVFDPARHLALERPQQSLGLAELGYTEAQIAACGCDFAVSSAFRLLSDEGVAALQQVCRQLEAHVVACERIERMMRGGVYRSRFLRGLCLSPDVTQFIGELCGARVAPHAMPHQLGHLNFQPRALGRNVDKWHHDTLALDYVLMVSDPASIEGGEFQYFRGTRDQVQAHRARGEALPAERIVSPHFPGAGYAVLQYGCMVVHRAAPLRSLGERISLVNGYDFVAANAADPTDFQQLRLVDPEPAISIEWLRHRAHRARRQLDAAIAGARLDADPRTLAAELQHSIDELRAAVEQVGCERPEAMSHYGD